MIVWLFHWSDTTKNFFFFSNTWKFWYRLVLKNKFKENVASQIKKIMFRQHLNRQISWMLLLRHVLFCFMLSGMLQIQISFFHHGYTWSWNSDALEHAYQCKNSKYMFLFDMSNVKLINTCILVVLTPYSFHFLCHLIYPHFLKKVCYTCTF